MAGIPLPRIQSFVICEEIYDDTRKGKCIIKAPMLSRLKFSTFPTSHPLSVYAELCNGHGSYDVELELKELSYEDPDKIDKVWSWRFPKKVVIKDPLAPLCLLFHDIRMEFPQPGPYDLWLLCNGQQASNHRLHVIQT